MELHASHLMLGRHSGALLELDLATRTVISKVCCASSCLHIALHWHLVPSEVHAPVCRTPCCSAAAHQSCPTCCLAGCLEAGCPSTEYCQQLWPCRGEHSLHSVPQMEAPASVSILRGPAGKGLLAVGSADGHIYLVDPRAGEPSPNSLPSVVDSLSCQAPPAGRPTQCTAGAGGIFEHTIAAHGHCLLALQVPKLSTPSQHMLGAWKVWMCGANSWPPAGMGYAWGR